MGFWDLITGKKDKEEKEIEQKVLEEKQLEKVSIALEEFKSAYNRIISKGEVATYCIIEECVNLLNINPVYFEDSEIIIMVRDKEGFGIHTDSLKLLIKKPNAKLKEHTILMENFKHFDSTVDEIEDNNGIKATIIYYMDGFGLEMMMLPYGCYEKLTELFPEKNINSEFFKDLDVVREEMAEFERKSKETNNVIA